MQTLTTSRTYLSFETTNQSLWSNGAAVELGFDTGDLFFVGPLVVDTPISIGGEFLGLDTDLFFSLEFGLLAYAGIGSPGSYDASIDISLDTRHSAIVSDDVVGGVDISEIVFDFSDFTVLESTLDSTAFAVGAEAGIDLVIEAELAFRDLTAYAFFDKYDIGDIQVADIDVSIPLISIGGSQLQIPADVVDIKLTGPTGADTSGRANGFASSGLVVTSSGVAAEPFFQLEADVDAIITKLLGKIKIPKLQAAVEVLENTIFGEFEFTLDNIRFLPSGLFTAEGTVVDLTASVGTAVSEDLELNFDDPNVAGEQPDVTITLRSDNGTPDLLSDDKLTTAKLGDSNVTLDIPDFPGFGNVSVDATYTLGDARLSHSMGLDIVGDFTIDLLKLETSGLIGDLIPDLEATTFQFPEGGFRGTLIDSFYFDSFDVTGFNQVNETYDVFYTSDLPSTGVDFDDPSAVQELISFLELLEVNRAASLSQFAPLLVGRDPAVLTNNFVPDDPTKAEHFVWTGDIADQANNQVNLGTGQLFADRDVVIVDAANASYGEDPGTNPTLRGSIADTASGTTGAFSGEIVLQEDLEAFLPNLFSQSTFNNGFGFVTARVEFIDVAGSPQSVQVSAGNSLNYNGAGGNDLLLYVGNEALFFDGGGNTNSATGDVFVASFAASHPLDSVSWDLRPNAVGQSGLNVDLALIRADTEADNLARLEADLLTTTTGNVTVTGTDLVMDGVASATGTIGDGTTALGEGQYTARIHLKGDLTGASTFTVETGDPNGAGFLARGTFNTAADNPGAGSLEKVIIVRDIDVGTVAEDIRVTLDSTGETITIDRIDFFEQHNVSLRNIESAALQLGDQSDTIVTSDTTDVIAMGGGADRLVVTADANSEKFLDLEAGADVAVYELEDQAGLGNPTGADIFDRVFGGAGGDEVLIQNLSTSGARWGVQSGSGTAGQEFGAESNSQNMIDDLRTPLSTLFAAAGFGTNSTDRTTVSVVDDANISAFTESGSGFKVGANFFDFEALSFIGSDTANDLAVFAGGAVYRGGASLEDVLVADFSQFTLPTGQENGIALSGFNPNGSVASTLFPSGQATFKYVAPIPFSDGQTERTSIIDGFERLVVHGTSVDDLLVGGEFAGDFLQGGGGNDVLASGGTANGISLNALDILDGGAGDDVFYVDGTELVAVLGGGDQDLVVLTPGEVESLSGVTVTGLTQSVDTDGTSSSFVDYDVNSTASELFDAIEDVSLGHQSNFFYTVSTSIGLILSDAESINLTGLDSTDDLLIYRNGATYEAGESANDRDTFAADFSAQQSGISWDLEADVDGTLLGNSIFVSGIDRAVLKLGSSVDSVTGGALDDHIEGNGGADFLRGGGSVVEDVLYGGEGADFFGWNANEGRVLINGGSDAGDTTNSVIDRLLVSSIDDAGDLQVGLTTGLGVSINTNNSTFVSRTATSSASSLTNAISDLALPTATFRITAGPGNEAEFSNIEATDVQGSGEMDDVIAVQGGDFYDGGDRDGDADILIANFSDETVDLSATARSGDDRVSLGATFADVGNGTTIGNFERFFIRGGSGDDSFTGGDFTDYLDGQGGDDILDGGAGDDTIDGGDGNDLLFYTGGHDSIIGGDGDDVLELGTLVGGYDGIVALEFIGPNPSQFAAVRRSDLSSTSDIQLLIPDLFDPQVDGFGLHGKGGFSTVTGEFLGADFVTFQDGASSGLVNVEQIVISADNDEDLLISGRDGGTLSGDGGDDVLVGRDGNDLLIGGAGRDSYVLSGNWGFDVIGGEISGTGDIVFLGLDFADVTFSVGGDDLFIDDSTTGAALTFLDYFAAGGNGLNYTFAFDDQTSTLNLSNLPGINPGGAITAGNTYFGTDDRDEMIESTAGADYYFARNGNDIILGSAGPDIISGGLGIDTVSYAQNAIAPGMQGVFVDLSGVGNQSGDAEGDILISIENVLGSSGDDQLFGDNKQNALAGSTGNDLLVGGNGNDALSGDAGNDTLEGDADDDSLFGGSGNDTLEGDAGDDFLLGAAGDDSLAGGTGNDIAIGGDGDDTADLGDGNDIYMIAAGDTVTGVDAVGTDSVDGGNDADTIDLSAFDASVLVDLSAMQRVTSTGQNATTGPGALSVLANLTGFENAVGTAFADTLLGNAAANSLAGDGGNDTLVGLGGDDLLLGNAGTDAVDYSATTGSVFVDLASETANDGQGGTDTLRGIEHIFGGNGAFDDLFGDDDGNTFTGNQGTAVDVIDGRGGVDTVDYDVEGGAGGVLVDLSTIGTFSAPNAFDTHGHGDALISIENIIGTALNDSITGSATGNTIVAGAGDDFIDGDGGFDVLDYSAERGAPAQGIISGLPGTGFITDRFGNVDTVVNVEAIFGTDFDDSISSGLGTVQEIHGGDGNDSIGNIGQTTGAGSTLFGGSGDDFLFGTNDNDLLFGGLGDDTAFGNLGEDVYFYVGGFDQFTGNPGARSDVDFSVFGSAVSVDLGAQTAHTSDTLDVTTGPLRSIMVMGSVDGATGGAGNDSLMGSTGNDFLSGGEGNDTFIGANGSDVIDGGAGIDLVTFASGGTGSVTIDTSLSSLNVTDAFGNVETIVNVERFVGTAGADLFIGGAGNDTFTGGDGVDSYHGGDGIDVLDLSLESGSLNAQVIFSFDSVTNETIGFLFDTFGNGESFRSIEHVIGNNGSFDGLFGGSGDETFTGRSGDDAINGNLGIDTLDYSYEDGNLGVTVNLSIAGSTASPNATDTHGDGDEVSGIENVVGSEQADALIGSSDSNTLEGRAGADTLTGMQGNDALIGGEGDDVADYSQETGGAGISVALNRIAGQVTDTFGDVDTLNEIEKVVGTSLSDTLVGNAEDNTFDGGDGNDTLDGLGGDDTLSGSLGNDVIAGFDGSDVLFGGIGNDTLLGENGADTLEGGAGADDIDGGADFDTASYASSFAAVDVTIGGSASGGDAAGDTLTDIENLLGSAFADTLTGDSAKNALTGGDGDDTLTGGDDDDTLQGGLGSDTLDGGAGNGDVVSYASSTLGVAVDLLNGTAINGDAAGDVVSGFEGVIGSAAADLVVGSAVVNSLLGGAGNDTINALNGDDVVFGGEGDNILRGQGGRDQLFASWGNDMITGGSGDDSLFGDDGDDLLLGQGSDDVIFAGAGDDSVLGGANADLIFGGDGVDSMLGQGGSDTLSGGEGDDSIAGGSGSDRLEGGDGDDTLEGQGNNDLLFGGDGNDFLRGAAGQDSLFGGNGDDTLFGGTAGDYLDGGAGNDLLNAGAQVDCFHFTVGSDSDTIAGFGDNQDTLQLTTELVGTLTAQQVLDQLATQSGASVVFDFGNDVDFLRVNSITKAALLDDLQIL